MDDNSPNIAGVCASPNEEGGQAIRFIDSEYNQLFTVQDGDHIVLTYLDGIQETLLCKYIDDCHAVIGNWAYHIHEFALVQEMRGAVYAPEHPQPGDIIDVYEIYQLKNPYKIDYGFCPYMAAKNELLPSHYLKVYAGVLLPKTTLEDLFEKHNSDLRPRRMEMRSMSVSDVVVMDRSGEKRAFYVDSVGFQEAKRFLDPPIRKKKRPAQER